MAVENPDLPVVGNRASVALLAADGRSESPTTAAGHRLPYCWWSNCGVVLISSTRDTEPAGERFAVG